MKGEVAKLKLGKGASFFVKTQLRRLRQEQDTWEADFFPIPCSDGPHDSVWWGLVLSHDHENVLPQPAFTKSLNHATMTSRNSRRAVYPCLCLTPPKMANSKYFQ